MFLKLKTLKIKAFRRFVNEQTIDFTNRENLVQIDGLRPETGGSSGSGKSSIPIAIDCLFGVSDISDKSLQSWLTKEPWSVEGVFDAVDNDGTHELIIKRSKKDGLSINLGGVVTSGSSKMAEEALDKIISVPRDLFRRMYHKKQKEGGFFIHLTAGQAYKTMTSVLNLTEMTDQVKKIEVKIAENEKELASYTFKKASAESNLTAVKGTLDSLQKPEQPEIKDVSALKLALENLKEQKSSLNQQKIAAIAAFAVPVMQKADDAALQVELTSVKDNIVTLAAEKTQLLKAKEDKTKQLQDMLEKFNKELADINLKRSKLQELDRQNTQHINKIEHIEKASCPTCSQTWANETAKIELDKTKAIVEANKVVMAELSTSIGQQATVESNITKVRTALSAFIGKNPAQEIEEKIAVLQDKMYGVQGQIKNLATSVNQANAMATSEYSNMIASVNNQFDQKSNEINMNINNLFTEITLEESKSKNYQDALAAFNKNSETLTLKVLELAKEVTKVGEDTFALNKKIAVGNEAKRAIKSYTLQIFQDSLDNIGEQATRILNATPNMATASIYFESARELADGKIKEEINAILSVDGEEDIPVKCLSGGEGTSIEIATDLAFLDMVESRVKIGTDFFFLDEPFNGLDSTNSLPIIDLLKSLDTNKKIIVVDHNPEVKEVITDRILVERIGTESNIIDRR